MIAIEFYRFPTCAQALLGGVDLGARILAHETLPGVFERANRVGGWHLSRFTRTPVGGVADPYAYGTSILCDSALSP
jgi:hypothetical protein